jgi:hypothetical protein
VRAFLCSRGHLPRLRRRAPGRGGLQDLRCGDDILGFSSGVSVLGVVVLLAVPASTSNGNDGPGSSDSFLVTQLSSLMHPLPELAVVGVLGAPGGGLCSVPSSKTALGATPWYSAPRVAPARARRRCRCEDGSDSAWNGGSFLFEARRGVIVVVQRELGVSGSAQ